MKKIMKVVSLVLTFALLVSTMIVPSVSVSADVTSGNITITRPNGSDVDLTTLKYKAYKILNATVDDDVVMTNGTHPITYTIPDSPEGLDGLLVAALKEADTANSELDTSDPQKIIKAIEALGNDDSKFQVFAKYLNDNKAEILTGIDPATSSTASEINFTGVELGYYLIVPTVPGTNIAALMVTSTDPNASMVAKVNAEPTVEKEIVQGGELADVKGLGKEIGSEVTYKITAKVPNTDGFKTYTFEIADTLSDGLDYVDGSLTVKVDGTLINAKDEDTHAENYDYELTKTDEHNIKVTFKDITKFSSNAASSDADKTGKDIIIEYKAKINSSAVVGGDGNANKVTLKYSNNPTTNDIGTAEEDNPPKVYTFGINVKKVDASSDSTVLHGAGFKLFKTSNNTYSGSRSYLKIDGAESVKDGIYTLVHNGADPAAGDEWKSSASDGSVFMTPNAEDAGSTGAEGCITIKGLMPGTYYLEEVIAPAGFNIAKITKIVITATGADADASNAKASVYSDVDGSNASGTIVGEADTDISSDGLAKVTVKDSEGAVLPETGGMGTTLLYTIGGALVIIAGVLLITKRRMHAAR